MDWKLKHITIGLFEASETTSQALAINLIELLDEYGVLKDQGANFNEIT
jgi:hypothetical protein